MALGMAFWCAYEGLIPEEKSSPWCGGCMTAASAASISPARSAWKIPRTSTGCSARLGELFPDAAFGFHIHNLSGMATANILAALDAGVQWLEGAICGIGGGIAMPTKLGSVGNFPTEDLVTMLAEMGIETGIDPERTVALRTRSPRCSASSRKATAATAPRANR